MEYNVSARNPDHALRDRLLDASNRADDLFLARDPSHAAHDDLCHMIRDFVRIRYLLEPEDMDESDSLNYLGELSLSKSHGIPIEAVRKSDLDSKCENTSSSMTKKILLVISLNSILGIDIGPDATADIGTIMDLCDEACRQLGIRPN